MTDALRFPTGRFAEPAGPLSPEQIAAAVGAIEAFPAALRASVAGLSDGALETPYRPGGWTVRQVVHHVADSHTNATLRFKWALTELDPTVKPYDEAAWATLPDTRLPLEPSLALVEGLHARWVAVMRALGPEDWARRYLNPESGPQRLDRAAAMYAWHGRHHLGHVALVTGG